MEDRNLDRIVKDMITNFELRYAPGSWERFERKLNTIEKKDSEFDRIVADKLIKHTIPFQSLYYSRFQNKAGLSSNRKYQTTYVLAVIAASLLLLFVALSILENKIGVPGSDFENKTMVLTAEEGKAKSFDMKIKSGEEKTEPEIKKSEQLFSVSEKTDASYETEIINIRQEKALNYGIAFRYLPYSENMSLMIFHGKDRPVNKLNDNISKNVFPIKNRYITGENIITMPLMKESGDESIASYYYKKSRHYKGPIDSIFTNTYIKDSAALASISDVHVESETTVNNEKSYNSPLISAFFYGGPKYLMIKTPNDLSISIPGYSNNTFGYIFGTGFSGTISNHELRTGIEYSNINYSPRKQILSFGNKSYWLEEISFGLLSIPLTYNYKLNVGKNILVYPSAGISAQFVTNSEYAFIEKTDGTSEIGKLAKDLIDNSDFAQTAYGAKEYRQGVLEGGNTSGNFNLDLIVALGISTVMNDELSIFLETGYRATILNNSFGPNNDRLSSFNLNIGINKSISL